ncbi:MAG TPA: hypothetical protein VFQ84_08615 [Arenimonas sp.]|uniref:hypothetical protein n=1 Tax=Arenimonas sp. TaxID=1872635 RepID=UPI002D803DAD|nr:hypothetical protein [Arenimonas sp.]HEU0153391.1 hypothetical protein [Arenimonas sp.]
MKRLACAAIALLALAGALPVAAQGFAVQVSPPRFEESAKPGTVHRNVIEVTNSSPAEGRFRLKTADWTLAPDGSAVFSDALAPGSCRPWVAIEAATLQVAPNARRRFRFEVSVPADAPDGQCRFALVIEGEPEIKPDGSMQVNGRIAIIVYLTIGDGAPVLTLVDTLVQPVEGRDLPIVRIRNTGNAHARLSGFLDAIGADGRRITLLPSADPILPGVTRDIALLPVAESADDPAPVLSFPLRLKGRLESPPLRLDIDTDVAKP